MDVQNKNTNRMLGYDFLRILACFSVIMQHSAAQHWYALPVTSLQWHVTNAYDAAFRFGVPLFVMISGALFLDPHKEFSVKRLYTHNILRLAVVYLLWSIIYAAWRSLQPGGESITLRSFSQRVVESEYHLWFLPMIIGIYMILPILRTWIQNAPKRQIEYFLLLFIIFQIGKETVIAFVPPYQIGKLVSLLPLEMVQSYIGYFVMGYYLAHIGVKKQLQKWIFFGGGVGVAGAILTSSFLSLWRESKHIGILDSYSIFTFLVTIALFVFGKEKLQNHHFGKVGIKIIRELSACTLGIYLIHLLVIEILRRAGFDSSLINIFLGVPLLSVACFAICLVIVMLLRRIPLLNRYIC